MNRIKWDDISSLVRHIALPQRWISGRYRRCIAWCLFWGKSQSPDSPWKTG